MGYKYILNFIFMGIYKSTVLNLISILEVINRFKVKAIFRKKEIFVTTHNMYIIPQLAINDQDKNPHK